MDLLNADRRWRYPLKYWLAHEQEAVGAQWFYLIRDGAHRALLTVGQGETAYAHFLGSDGQRYQGYDELLYFEAATRLMASGFKRFHLGGGTTMRANDSLLMFKRKFSKTMYRVGSYHRVVDQEVFDYLKRQKERDEKRQHGRVSMDEWFPPYRREFA
jgi:hypothetical protein